MNHDQVLLVNLAFWKLIRYVYIIIYETNKQHNRFRFWLIPKNQSFHI